jgi:hypothetical protein
MKRLLPLLALAACATATAAPTVTGNLLANGSFESTPVANGSWVNVSTLSGWTQLGGPGTGFEIRNNVAGRAQDGSNYIELDTTGNTLIGQYLDDLAAGARFDLNFWYSPRESQAASTNGIQVFWNGALLGPSLTELGSSGNIWSLHQYSVTAQAGRNLLSFASVGTSDSLGGNLDNVSLRANGVPEPGSLALCLAALGGMLLAPGALRRHAQQRRAVALASSLKST